MPFDDKTLTCQDCNTSFTFTASEQEFFASKGYTNEPKRCPEHRAARKQQNGGGNGSGFSSGPRQMYSAVCSNCGKDAQLPFQPRGDRPVFCSDCYSTRRPERPSYSGGGSRY